MKKTIILACVINVVGCAHTEKYLHPERTFSLDTRTEAESPQLVGLPFYETCADKASIHSPVIWVPLIGPAIDVTMSAKNTGDSRGDNLLIFLPLLGPAISFSGVSPETCTYKTFKQNDGPINPGIPVTPDAVDYVTTIADQNCSIFLDRLSSSKEGLDFTKTALTDIGAAIASGTAFASPLGGAVVATASLLTNKGAENMAHTYFGGQLIPAIKNSIKTERDKYKAEHITMTAPVIPPATPPNTTAKLIQVFDEYDRTCSVQSAIDNLNKK